jgi:hypothetical protein
MKWPDDLVEWVMVVVLLSLAALMWLIIVAALTGGLHEG